MQAERGKLHRRANSRGRTVVKAVERASRPQDVEWAIDPRRTETRARPLQRRPEVVWSRKANGPVLSKRYAPGIQGVLSTLLTPLASRNY